MPKKKGSRARDEGGADQPGIGPEPIDSEEAETKGKWARARSITEKREAPEATWEHLPAEYWDPERIHPQPWNPRQKLGADVRAKLKRGIEYFGHAGTLIVRVEDGMLIGGHQRYEIMLELLAEHRDNLPKLTRMNLTRGQIPVSPIKGMPDKQAMALNILLNNRETQGIFDLPKEAEILSYLDGEGFDATLAGYSNDQIEEILTWSPGGEQSKDRDERTATLASRFGIPPFTVFDARQGYWQKRKKEWLELGIQSERERDEMLLGGESSKLMREMNAGTSTFDPVLADLIIRWFCPKGGAVLDPFAGGSVRGIVAALLGRKYVGIELRPEQAEENRRQAAMSVHDPNPMPEWIDGDSLDILKLLEHRPLFDLILTSPPYYDLERYSKDPRDLSNRATYADFIGAYRQIVWNSLQLLADDRFAVYVVGEIRDKAGHYRNFVGDTASAFIDGGAHFYNEAILLHPLGNLPVRAAGYFEPSRKLGHAHANVLNFVKGDERRATERIGPVEFADPEEAIAAAKTEDAPQERDDG